MPRFTNEHYDKAIADIADARGQLEPDGRVCVICHDSGHQAWECGSNPLLAMVLCAATAKRANELHDKLHGILDDGDAQPQQALQAIIDWREEMHEFLHWLSGACSWMGSQVGPAKVREPKGTEPSL